MTPQEHRGSGTPNREAFITGQSPLPPRWVSTNLGEIKTESTPETKKPNNKYGDMAVNVVQKLIIIDKNASINI
jgi:hypothetical protein